VKLPGETPRFITLDPTEKFLLVGLQNSGIVCVYRVNECGTGMLSAQPATEFDVPYPACMVFVSRDRLEQ